MNIFLIFLIKSYQLKSVNTLLYSVLGICGEQKVHKKEKFDLQNSIFY